MFFIHHAEIFLEPNFRYAIFLGACTSTYVSSPDKCVLAGHRCFFASHITVSFLMIFGRTELIISVSEAGVDEDADGEVHWHPNPQKPDEKRKKNNSD